MMKPFEILDWDSAFFGIKTARVNHAGTDWGLVIESLRSAKVALAYWQFEKGSEAFRHFANKNKGFLADIKTTYSTLLSEKDYPEHEQIELYQETEPNDQLLKLAVQCGAYSRFLTDPNIPQAKFEELYRLWMIQSANKKMADDIIVYRTDKQIVGVVTVYLKNERGNIGLIGVDEQFRGRSIGKALIYAAKAYFCKKGTERLDVVTQGMNQQACALYERTGFTVSEQYDFYHFWL